MCRWPHRRDPSPRVPAMVVAFVAGHVVLATLQGVSSIGHERSRAEDSTTALRYRVAHNRGPLRVAM